MPHRLDEIACLTDEELAEVFSDAPDAELVASIEEHIAACASCRELVVGMARTNDDAGVSTATAPAKEESFGRYVLRDVIGVGAMGIVYAAHDPHLRRKIAIKVLKPGVGTANAKARARLLKEARAIARLAHPNVVTVHDVGLQTEHVFLAMEHIDGQTLREWLAAKRRSCPEILAVFLQAARGLAAAHRAGVVHRDFKPANVLVGNDGRVCVTDFGLAHMSDATASQVSAEAGAAAVPLDVGQTVSGMLIGTPAYMAPEQLCGETATERSDQFSFAVTLFEALHRRRPYGGANLNELRENIVAGRLVEGKDDGVPAYVRRALRRALVAQPAHRYPSMDALIAALEPPRRRAVWISAALVAAAGGTALIGLRSTPRAFEASVQSSRRITFDSGCDEFPSFFPDGQTIVFDTEVDGGYQLFTFDLGTGARRQLTFGAGWNFGAAVAADGQHLAYVHTERGNRELRVLALDGAAEPTTILEKARGFPSWSRDGRVLAPGVGGEILALDPTARATPARIGSVPDGALALQAIELPSGTFVAVWDRAKELAVGELAVGGQAVTRDDHLRQGTLAASQRADAYYYERPGPTGPFLVWRPVGGGEPTLIPGGIVPGLGLSVSPDRRRLVWSTCKFSMSLGRAGARPTERIGNGDFFETGPVLLGGTRILFRSERSGRPQLWSLDLATGKSEPVAPPGSHGGQVSPDGRTLVYLDPDRGPGIWRAPIGGGTAERLTDDASDDAPAVAFDGRVIFKRTEPGRGQRIFILGPGSAPRAITPPGATQALPSPTDDTVVYVDTTVPGGTRPMRTDLGGAPPVPVAGLAVGAWRNPTFAPDGKSVLIVHDNHEILEAPLDGHAPPVVRWSTKAESLWSAIPAPDGDGYIVDTFRYEGDLWLAEGSFP